MKLLSQLIGLYVPAANPLKVTAIIVSALISLKTSATLLSKSIKWKKVKKTIPLENDMWAIE